MNDILPFDSLKGVECPKCGLASAFEDMHYDNIDGVEVLLLRCIRCEYALATKTKDAPVVP